MLQLVALEILNNICEFQQNLWVILDFVGRSVNASNRLRMNFLMLISSHEILNIEKVFFDTR